jgi:hypothetical protein
MEEICNEAKSALIKTTEEVMGYIERGRKEWMSSGTLNTIKQRREAKMKLNMAKTRQQKIEKSQVQSQLNQQVKKEVRWDKRRWLDNQAQKAEAAAKQGNMKKLYDTMRALISKPKMGRPIKSKDGHLLTNEQDQMERWREYFLEILNRDITKNEGEEDDDVENQRELRINTEVPSKSKILQAVKSLRDRKTPGVDRIPLEVLKVDPHTTELLYPVIKRIWTEEKMPEDWRKGILIKISKKRELN